MIKVFSLLLLSFVLLFPSKVAGMQLGSNTLNLPGFSTIENIEFSIEHRFYGAIDDNFLGIDAGANTSIGLGFRLKDNLDFSVFRSPVNKEYYVAGKWNLSDSFSILAGATTKTSSTVTQDKNTMVGQLIYYKEILNDSLSLGFVPTYVNAKNDNPTIALGTSIGYLPNSFLEISLEYIPVIAGYTLKYPSMSFGIKMKTWGHFFTLLLSNTFQTLPDGYVIGSDDNKYHFGFNIIRKFL